MQGVMREPLSPRSTDTINELVEQIDQFAGDLTAGRASRLTARDRAKLRPSAQRIFQNLHDMLSVAEQVEELGRGRAPWRSQLAHALGRLERTLRRAGIFVTRNPSPIVAKVSAAAGSPFLVATVTRRPELDQYIALALRRARTRELEAGHWYADLEDFPGVWADGASAEECRETLGDVLHEWLLVKIAHRDRDIPVIDNIDPATLLHG